ncbi:hypothetical protein SISSUDRAFT_1031566 [Sistotremastrum suecicum HHB10207 ss-3]|uniref:Uncharacterized protein n=1 Tax=Sistotremastrum suecicum HHB10207 ss-3 TaxID=1314776 RepID=A0A166FTR1_9AGAM|nr:hypothetical protein SISSUDRAFT_1031566 [Sistotremastrum suecicum HHB10207 ss-3]
MSTQEKLQTRDEIPQWQYVFAIEESLRMPHTYRPQPYLEEGSYRARYKRKMAWERFGGDLARLRRRQRVETARCSRGKNKKIEIDGGEMGSREENGLSLYSPSCQEQKRRNESSRELDKNSTRGSDRNEERLGIGVDGTDLEIFADVWKGSEERSVDIDTADASIGRKSVSPGDRQNLVPMIEWITSLDLDLDQS